MKKILSILTLLVLTVLFYISCNSILNENNLQFGDQTISNPLVMSNGVTLSDKNNLTYISPFTNSVLSNVVIQNNLATHQVISNISIITSSGNISINYALDFNSSVWKVIQKNKLSQKIDSISQLNLPLNSIQAVITDLENIMDMTVENSSVEVGYSLSSNLSIFKTLERRIISPNNGGCTIHPAFLVGKSLFACQEDFVFNKFEFVNFLDSVESASGSTSEIQKIRTMLLQHSSNNLSFKEIYSSVIPTDTFNNRLNELINNPAYNNNDCDQAKCGGLCGSSWGCCGNYKGCCWYSSLFCLWHDIKCRDCKPTAFCLPGCKPGYVIVDPNWGIEPGNGNPTFPGHPGGSGTPQPVSFPSDYSGTYNYIPTLQHFNSSYVKPFTMIYKNDNQYYYNLSRTCLLKDGFYYNNDDPYYYKVEDGVVIEKGNLPNICIGCSAPIKPVGNPFAPCN